MAMMKPLDVVVQDEYQRFLKGLHGLDPGSTHLVSGPTGSNQARPHGTGTITIPGWDQIIKIPGGVQLTKADFKAYYKAQRTGKPSGLDDDTLAALQRAIGMRAAQQSTTQPGYSLSIGQIMTAIDNYQDMLSTLATIGRLLIWAAPRIGLRAVPVVGWVVLAADILNLFNFVGMVASPLYAMMCAGPKDALAAGLPAAVLKNALCKEAWTQARLNPFSRAARANRALRSMGKLPGFSNLIEVLQVTDTLFGAGLSIGAAYGTVMEILFASTSDQGWAGATVNTSLFKASFTDPWKKVVKEYPPTALSAALKAARLAQMAPIIAGQHDMFPDDVHLGHMAAMVGAVSLVTKFMQAGPVDELMRELLPGQWAAPAHRPDYLDEIAPGVTDDDAGVGRWWIAGNPRSLDGERLFPALAAPVTSAVTAFLKPRRNRVEMTFYGACLNQITDHWWSLIAGDADAFTWKLTTDYVILTSMVVEGLLVRQGEALGPLWRFWTMLRERVEAKDGAMLERPDILHAADAAGIVLMRLLPTHVELPAEWGPYLAAPTGFTQWPQGIPRVRGEYGPRNSTAS